MLAFLMVLGPLFALHALDLSKLADGTTQRVSPNVSYGLWVKMCQCRSVSYNKRTILVWSVDSGRVCASGT